MMDDAIEKLQNLNIEKENIHSEKF
jgi:ferredoxin-NADP reductase